MKHSASVDFVVFNRVTNRLVLVIEVDGFKYHEDIPAQFARDALKDQIFAIQQIPLLRLPTTGSGEERLIREKLDLVMNVDADTRPGDASSHMCRSTGGSLCVTCSTWGPSGPTRS